MVKRLKNRDRAPKQFTPATATNGVLTAGGRVLGSIGSTEQGKYLVVKSGAGFVAIKQRD